MVGPIGKSLALKNHELALSPERIIQTFILKPLQIYIDPSSSSVTKPPSSEFLWFSTITWSIISLLQHIHKSGCSSVADTFEDVM